MRKIHIIGAPGSGKTTLAQELSSRLNIPHYDLDKIDWEQEKAPLTIARRSAWIAEGIFLIWTEPFFYHADCIVFLEVSWPVAAWRIIRRHIWNSLRGQQRYPGIKTLLKFLDNTRRSILNLDRLDSSLVQSCFQTRQEMAEPLTEDSLTTYFETYQELSLFPSEEFARLYLERYKQKLYLIRNAADRERFLAFVTQKG